VVKLDENIKNKVGYGWDVPLECC